MELKDFLSIIKKRLWFLILVTVLVTGVTYGITKLYLQPQYRASTLLIIGDENLSSNQKPSMNDLNLYQDLAETYAQFASTRKVATDVMNSLNLKISAGEVQSMISATTSKDSRFLTITVMSSDKTLVAPMANQVVTSLKNVTKDLVQPDSLHVIDEAQDPSSAFSPNTRLNLTVAFVIGIMLSIVIIFLHEYIDSTVKDEDELSKLLGAPVLGIIPSSTK
ncbi:YveK family protein [Clostridium manihotivorum]|uniref:Lipopolysaccharide biosynthesis protein n=1 Tax=Clostridium manihotivorum TaxID=2320868 RepID=A0A3R5VBQ1_9CLOT|nr:Wzz/FepE/Etk N-terminal domain-containing protein [Clostridium manihotivorum]QAA34741.1 lipopolysaccharide biosynthesis protein [Clostridium manihotivorum]